MNTMKAAVVPALGAPLEIRDLPIPEPGPGQVLVRMLTSGVCHTDIHAARGDWPVKPEPRSPPVTRASAWWSGSVPVRRSARSVTGSPSPGSGRRAGAAIAWWSLSTVAARVVMVWLFANTGRSVFAMALFHAVLNLGWQLFPVRGSYFDQPAVAVLMAAVALVVALLWGPRSLAGRRGAAPAGGRRAD
jgi:hypothetical protein